MRNPYPISISPCVGMDVLRGDWECGGEVRYNRRSTTQCRVTERFYLGQSPQPALHLYDGTLQCVKHHDLDEYPVVWH